MRLIIALLFALLPGVVWADAPKVLTSIKPVYDLVKAVMVGAGEPEMLLSQNDSPHHASLRPSRMRSLTNADLLVWIGPNMEPWLEKALGTLAPETERLRLIEVAGLRLLKIRQPATLASDEDQELATLEKPEDPQFEQDSDFFVAEDNSLEADLEDQAALEADAADAETLLALEGEGATAAPEISDAFNSVDPHIWLDPMNSALLLDAIAAALAKLDPENSDIYRGNAEAAKLALSEAVLAAKDQLVYLTDSRFIYNHDSFQYFEAAFGLKSIGFLNTSDAKQVGARTVSEITANIEFAPVICIVIDKTESSRAVKSLFPDQEMIALDPMGWGFDPAASYPAALFLNLAEGYAECD